MTLPVRSRVILAGGGSTRFGPDKAYAEIGGRTLLERAVDGVGASTPWIVTDDPERAARILGERPHRLLSDETPGLGPVEGLRVALAAVAEGAAWVVAVDLPFLQPAIGELLFERFEGRGRSGHRVAAVVPELDGRLQPLCAVYDPSVAVDAAVALESDDPSMHHLLRRIPIEAVASDAFASIGDPSRLFLNVNRPEDLELARRLADES